jgi:non-specific serine/threonine protein kinase
VNLADYFDEFFPSCALQQIAASTGCERLLDFDVPFERTRPWPEARAMAVDSDFSPHGENLRAMADICRRLDGIPLATEFAAARAAILGPDLVLSRLDERFGLLTGGRRTALPRHQTLRATLDWSYEPLPEPERCLLRRLGIFPAGFTLEVANALMSDQSHPTSVTLEQIANLIAKSLVTLDGSASIGRWRLLETLRAYALEILAENGETEQVARRCAEFCRRTA